MAPPVLGADELVGLARVRRLSTLFGAPRGEPVVLVELGDAGQGTRAAAGARELRAATDLGTVPAVLVGIGPLEHPHADLVDVVAADTDEAAAITDAAAARPITATALALLLRHGDDRSIAAGLVAESATYSMLQSGPEFAAWRASRAARPRRAGGDGPPVVVDDRGERITIRLNRPAVHNAVNTALAEHLVDALTAALDDSRPVLLCGAGRSFCSGGDLDEFGSFDSPADAHGVRLLRSAGQAISMIGDRGRSVLHGAAMGAGIELPAFGGRIVADAATRIALPEIGLGLVPGAGGTVSLPRRIGRHRTASLALTGAPIDAQTALAWGLIDEIVDVPAGG